MKFLTSFALILGLTHAKPKDDLETASLMTAIAAVENSRYDQIGMAGERSPYQITSTVWLTHSELSFLLASEDTGRSRDEVRRVVKNHLAWIRCRLPRLHYPASPYSIALVWKAGFGRCLTHKVRTQDVEYAKRVANVYEEITK
jgi:hypothetical protein